jgi:hypothetical protein
VNCLPAYGLPVHTAESTPMRVPVAGRLWKVCALMLSAAASSCVGVGVRERGWREGA